MALVGKPVSRKEGRKRVTGAALYVDDLKFEGVLHGVTVRSSVPRGRIKSISFEQPQAIARAGDGPGQPPATAGGTDRSRHPRAMLRSLSQPLPKGEGKEAGGTDRSRQPPAMLRPLTQPLPKGEGKEAGGTDRSRQPPAMLRTLTQPLPKGEGKEAGGTDRSSAGGTDFIPWDEFTIVTAKDIPGDNYVALILNDQPYLADEVVNHPEEPIVLLAHQDKYLLEEARRHVSIEYEEMPAIFSLEDSLAEKEIIWGEDNVFKKFLVDKGNVDDVWSQAASIVEGEYETGAQEQLYI